MITAEILAAYKQARDPGVEKSVVCHAPFISLNFEQSGSVTSCCYNRDFVLGTYPAQSVREIWMGDNARRLREAFLHDEEAPGCDLCFHQLANRNFGGTLMRNFDRYARDPAYHPELEAPLPRMLEFEIANTCNLECVMCAGHWSSAIRAHREHLPPLKSPYDRAFVDQLEEFLPSLQGAKFLGGEPFLIKRYYEIWERIRRLNPEAELTITTNATFLPERAREVLEELRVCPVISLDAITGPTYEAIRKRAHFDQVMANVEYFLEYTKRRGTWVTLACCPMTYNWRELPDLLRFCEAREIQVHFNTVLRPFEASLAGLSAGDLTAVVGFLESYRPAGDAWWTRRNRQEWEGLVSQLRGWRDEKLDFARRRSHLEAGVRRYAAAHPEATGDWDDPKGFERLASALVLSLCIARKRETGDHGDLQTILPRVPGALATSGEAPGAQTLLLATHLLCRSLAALEGGEPAAAQTLAAEQRRLREYLAQREQGDPAWVEEWSRWLREHVGEGHTGYLMRWMGELLEALERPEAWRRELERGLAELEERGLDELGRRKVAACFEGVIARFLPSVTDVPWLDLGSQVPFPPVRERDDLRRLMDAITLLRRCCEPAARNSGPSDSGPWESGPWESGPWSWEPRRRLDLRLDAARGAADELDQALAYLEGLRPTDDGGASEASRRQWDALVQWLRAGLVQDLELAQRLAGVEQGLRTFAGARPEALADWSADFERLLPALALSLEVARARERGDHALSSRTPIPLVAGGEVPGTEALLLATHLLGRWLDEAEGKGGADASALGEEQRRLRGYVERRRRADAAWLGEWDRWLRERIEKGEILELRRWTAALLDAFERAERWGRAPDAAEQSGLGELDASARTKLAAYLDAIAAHYVPIATRLPWLDLGSERAFPAVESRDDLRRLLDAVSLLHRRAEPSADHEAFRLRLEAHLDGVAADTKAAETFRPLAGPDLALELLTRAPG